MTFFENIPEEIKRTDSFGYRLTNSAFNGGMSVDEDFHPVPIRILDRNFLPWDMARHIIELGEAIELVWITTKKDRFWVLDIDDVIDREKVERFLNSLNTYTEVSRSGEGYHVIGKYDELPAVFSDRTGGKLRTPVCTLELFVEKQITLTGNIWNGKQSIRTCDADLLKLTDLFEHWKKKESPVRSSSKTRTDEDVMRLVMEKRPNVYDALNRFDEQATNNSEVDFKIMACLLYYSGDKLQTKRIFEQSARWNDKRRKKKGNSYIERSISKITYRGTFNE